MRQMCLRRVSEALRGQRPDADPLGVVFELAAAQRRPSASLGPCEPRSAQDGRQVAPPAAGCSAALAHRPAGPSRERLGQQLGVELGHRVQLDDRPPPEPLLVPLGGVRDQAGQLQPRQPSLHALAVRLDKPSPGGVSLRAGNVAPAHDGGESHDQLRQRAAVAGGSLAAGPPLPSPPPPQVGEQRERRGFQPGVPRQGAPGLGAGVFDRGQDFDAERLGRQWTSEAKRPPRGRPRPAGTRVILNCHRQRRARRRSRRQSRATSEACRAADRQPRCGSVRNGGMLASSCVRFGRAPVALSGTSPASPSTELHTRSLVVKGR